MPRGVFCVAVASSVHIPCRSGALVTGRSVEAVPMQPCACQKRVLNSRKTRVTDVYGRSWMAAAFGAGSAGEIAMSLRMLQGMVQIT
jgi:hypothetical protein